MFEAPPVRLPDPSVAPYTAYGLRPWLCLAEVNWLPPAHPPPRSPCSTLLDSSARPRGALTWRRFFLLAGLATPCEQALGHRQIAGSRAYTYIAPFAVTPGNHWSPSTTRPTQRTAHRQPESWPDAYASRRHLAGRRFRRVRSRYLPRSACTAFCSSQHSTPDRWTPLLCKAVLQTGEAIFRPRIFAS